MKINYRLGVAQNITAKVLKIQKFCGLKSQNFCECASVREQAIPFLIRKNIPNDDTMAALNEFYEMKAHPEKYKRYSTFRKVMDEVLSDD